MRTLFAMIPLILAAPALAAQPEYPIYDCAEGGYEENATPIPVPAPEITPIPSS